MYINNYIIDIVDGYVKLPDIFDVSNRKLYYFLKEEGKLSLLYAERYDNAPDEMMIEDHSLPVHVDVDHYMPIPKELIELTGAKRVLIEGKIVGFELNFEVLNHITHEQVDRVHRLLNLK